ncbi:metal ABC transporter substrate-binding protein [Moraxella sp. VT-16-12]|uniref:metal ABC transporter substrate-binding protein n=1 Tax=Moraxella sp. VT-16-12 TaxID=2014877 RepID=UPI000B7CC527|nr:metal ABC transporter substrate-binding protein [Moraxella sp. VT-16-12]TWV83471.1 metal ABC transporter substrate-binding protein [Moraxella sp. VT-16-12]
MKPLKTLMLGFSLCLALVGCNKTDTQTQQTQPQQDKFTVVTTFTVIADIAQNVAGDAAVVESITKAGAEIHDYEPTPKDIAKVQTADLILYNGMNLERWFEKFYQDAKNVPAVVVTDGITPLPIKAGAYKDLPNPHAWMSPSNALVYVENIKNALVQYDPANKDTYIKNAQEYSQKIKDLDAPLRAKLDKIPQDKRWLVTSEGAFSYLAKDYGLQEAYLWDINAEQQGSPKQVKALIDIVRTNKIPVVFSESTISDKPAKQVAKETGASYGGVLYVDSLSEKDGAVPTYLDLLNVTVSTVVKGFEDAQAQK